MWEQLSSWWLDELADPTYEEELAPLMLELLDPEPDTLYLDVGCGDGRLMSRVTKQAHVIGCDASVDLLRVARSFGPVFRCRLPDLGCVRPAVVGGAIVSLVLEHLPGEDLFDQLARVVRPSGHMAMIINHPIWTAPDSTPIDDASGETLWRPGHYFGGGFSDEPAGEGMVRFYHRTMATLVNSAADAGWDLQRMEERGVSEVQLARVPEYEGQEHIPRVLGLRWRRRN